MDPAQRLPLGGQSAFITGAGRGLGAAIAHGLAQAGARVVLGDIDAGAARVQARWLTAEGFEALALALDVRDEAAFQKAFDLAVAQLGPIGLMVNNAALTPTTSMWDIAAQEWDDVMAVNLRGCFFGCRIAGRHMREQEKGGRILNLSSIAGQQASAATGVHYAATKAGILAITRSFAQALAPDGITVNALAPSAVESPALVALDPQRRHALQASIPLGRFGDAQEVAAAAVYLASPAAAFITGVTLDVNGGRLMR
jgi:3-oxoacyl-[acyl-carrier protein] reductase